MNATQPPARKTPAHILAANQASRQRLKAAHPPASKARTKKNKIQFFKIRFLKK